MSQSKHQLNHRKRAKDLLDRTMLKDGFEFKKQVKNRITYRNPETGEKVHKVLEVE